MPFYGKDTTWAGKTPNLFNSFGHIKKAVNDPTYLLKPQFWKGAAESRKLQRKLFDKLTNRTKQTKIDFAVRKRKATTELPHVNKKQNMPKYKSRKTFKKGYKPKGKGKKRTNKKSSRKGKRKMSKSSDLTNTTVGSFSLSYKKPKGYKYTKETVQEFNVQIKDAFGAAPLTGRQAVSSLGLRSINSQQILVDLYAAAAQRYDTQSAVWIKENALINPVTTGNRKMFIRKISATYTFVNQGPTSNITDVYWLLPKDTQKVILDPAQIWNTGYSEFLGNASGNSSTFVGAKPTDSKDFNMVYKIVKKFTWKFDPGQERIIRFTFNVNRFVDTDYINSFQCIKGLTMQTLLVVKGVTADTAQTHAIANISLTPAKVIGHATYSYTGHIVNCWPRMRGVLYDNFTTQAMVNDNSLPLWSVQDQSGASVNSNRNDSYA